jgi:MazG family protein
MPNEPPKSIDDLLAVMAALRTPKSGCPWDLEQTFATIAPYTIEEAYEVADAITRLDLAALKDELGDLLLQVVYHARMAEEENAFSFADVVDSITRKMLRRHPHVFGTEAERAAGATPGFWDRIKAAERPEQKESESLLDQVPVGLPGLTRAVKLQNKAAKVGFDWPNLKPVFEKLKEEIGELEDAIGAQSNERTQRDAAGIEEEFGDLLFVVANIARHLAIDPESALRAANEKFIRRFRHIEARLAAGGRTPAQSTLAEMDTLWNEAKLEDKRRS